MADTANTPAGYGYQSGMQSSQRGEDSVRKQIAHLISSVQTVLRLPLIVVDLAALVFLLVFG